MVDGKSVVVSNPPVWITQRHIEMEIGDTIRNWRSKVCLKTLFVFHLFISFSGESWKGCVHLKEGYY
jgi:hypothetical protein